jgi:hypothetical protein
LVRTADLFEPTLYGSPGEPPKLRDELAHSAVTADITIPYYMTRLDSVAAASRHTSGGWSGCAVTIFPISGWSP